MKPTKPMKPGVLTANRLDDGLVVYLTGAGGWSHDLSDGRVASDAQERSELQAIGEQAAAARLVVAPYFIDVAVEDGRPAPQGTREVIRALHGPTITPPTGLPTAAATHKDD